MTGAPAAGCEQPWAPWPCEPWPGPWPARRSWGVTAQQSAGSSRVVLQHRSACPLRPDRRCRDFRASVLLSRLASRFCLPSRRDTVVGTATRGTAARDQGRSPVEHCRRVPALAAFAITDLPWDNFFQSAQSEPTRYADSIRVRVHRPARRPGSTGAAAARSRAAPWAGPPGHASEHCEAPRRSVPPVTGTPRRRCGRRDAARPARRNGRPQAVQLPVDLGTPARNVRLAGCPPVRRAGAGITG